MSEVKILKEKTKIIPINYGDMIIGIPFDITKEKFEGIFIHHLIDLGLDKNGDLRSKIYPFLDELTKRDGKFYLVNQMVQTFSDISQDLVNKASLISGEGKTILHILARNVSALGAAQLLFNYAYYIEFITILRMIFEQCGYVVSWVKNGKKPSKGPHSIQISEFSQKVPSATKKLYGELCETAHLHIYKDNKIKTVSNEFENEDALILASKQKTLKNYPIFLNIFCVLAETTSYVISKEYSDDEILTKYTEVLLLNKECIKMVSETGHIHHKKILELFPNALEDAVKGFDENTKKEIIDKFGSLEKFIKAMKE